MVVQTVDDLGGRLTGLLVDAQALDGEGLADEGEIQQGIGGHGLAGNLQIVEQGDGRPDLVGLFDLIGAVYGQPGDFFWVWPMRV